jgi:hypothetical protein
MLETHDKEFDVCFPPWRTTKAAWQYSQGKQTFVMRHLSGTQQTPLSFININARQTFLTSIKNHCANISDKNKKIGCNVASPTDTTTSTAGRRIMEGGECQQDVAAATTCQRGMEMCVCVCA